MSADSAAAAEPLRILSIGAHPADIFDQSGGAMAHHAARGDWVGCVVLTHGARVHDAVISDGMFHREEVPEAGELKQLMAERSGVKAEEVRRACRSLGVEEVRFLGIDDAVLLVTEEAVRTVARLLRELKPDIVLTHFPREGDGKTNAHATAGQIVMHALSHAAGVDPGDRRPPHKVAQVFFFGCGEPPCRATSGARKGGTTTTCSSTSPTSSTGSSPPSTPWSARGTAAPTRASGSRPATAPSGRPGAAPTPRGSSGCRRKPATTSRSPPAPWSWRGPRITR